MSILEMIVLTNLIFNFLLVLFLAHREDVREEEQELEEYMERMSWKQERTLYNVDLKKEINNDQNFTKNSKMHIFR